MILDRLIQFHRIVLIVFNLSISAIVVAASGPKLLNARKASVEGLTTPGNFYFLEFPLDEESAKLSPICANGSPFGFAFRRGTDEHMSKLLIEFEGGSACWSDNSGDSCCNSGSNLRKQVPWYDYLDTFSRQVIFQKTFPELGTCSGISSGFLTEAADVIFSSNNAITSDLPIPLRDDQEKGWWETLGGETDIRDWSYILIPHCSMDWHLGHQEAPQITQYCSKGSKPAKTDAVYHRGGTNVDAVMNWVKREFPSGLDALVTIAGGKVGGCNANTGAESTSTIAPAILASKLSRNDEINEDNTSSSKQSTLVVTEGANLWSPDLPSPQVLAYRWNAIDLPSYGGLPQAMETFVASSINTTQFIWMASDEGKGVDEERLWFMKQANIHTNSFHVYEPQSKIFQHESHDWCPIYAFPDSDADVSAFFANVIERMSWSSSTSEEASKVVSSSLNTASSSTSNDKRSQLSFLSISIIISGLVVLSWIIYFVLKDRNSKNGRKAPLSPTDLWFIALTKYPLEFYFVSLFIPILLTTIAFSRNELRVNMDFDSYLEVNTDLENVKRNYKTAQENQQASLEWEEANCQLYGNSQFQRTGYGFRNLFGDSDPRNQPDIEPSFSVASMFDSRSALNEYDLDVQIDQKLTLDMLSPYHRELVQSNLNYFSGGEWISIMYQNREGGNVFEPEVLKAIHDFENSIYTFPEFSDYCYGFGANKCLPIDSLVSFFFNNGVLVNNINSVLRTFLSNQPALWKLDQYFGADNLQSNVTRSFVFLKNMGGDQSGAHPFLKRFYRDFLLKHDQEKTYPAMIHTWNNFITKTTEADDALFHDTLWSIGSLCFIALMILLKVQSFFVVFSSMLGLVLSFSVAYYWVSEHFMIHNITLIWVAGLFVMLGIGADDIFLMVDSFDHTKYEFEEDISVRICDSEGSTEDESNDQDSTDANIEILQQRMISAYKKAGSMMLVSSVTTSICFFSNAFGVLTVIQEFGIYMGMVVLINYLHVMTILPSSILVDKIYVVPLRNEFVEWWKSKFPSKNPENENQGQGIDQPVSLEESQDAIAEKYAHNHASEGQKQVAASNIEKSSNNMNSLDRFLVQTYAPFVTRRPLYLIGLPIVLAIILGVLGTLNFSLNDGTIVLFSDRYNLGRLETITDLYYNDDEDVYTTIEEDTPSPTFAPASHQTSVPALKPTLPPAERDPSKLVNASVVIKWRPPEESSDVGLPGAMTIPPNTDGSSISNVASANSTEEENTNPGLDIGTNSTQGESTKTDSNQTDSTQTDSTQTDSTQIDSNQTKSTQTDSTQTDSNQTDSTQTDSPQTDTGSESNSNQADTGSSSCSGPYCGSGIGSDTGSDNHSGIGAGTGSGTGSGTSHGTSYGTGSAIGSTTGSSTGSGASSSQTTTETSSGSLPQEGASTPDAGSIMQQAAPVDKVRPTTSTGMRRRETIQVKLIWGVESGGKKSSLWLTNSDKKQTKRQSGESAPSSLTLADPRTQEWLLEVSQMAKTNPNLYVREDKFTWIERLRDFAAYAGVEFPIPERLFSTYLELAKSKDPAFADLIRSEIGTSAPGYGGDFTFTSITMMVDAVEVGNAAKNISVSESVYQEWTQFTAEANTLSPPEVPMVVAQSSIFLDAYRVEATIDSTLVTWFVANGLCLLVILVFIQNLALSVMVMVTIILILFCLEGLLFAVYRIPFGPVEALGVSIFIGLSANYSLHVVHAYRHSESGNRESKIKEAIFAVGSPIIASALSTMGASAFLFGCRTYVFWELGLLICSITGMALLYTMAFLSAWLSTSGPIPIDESAGNDTLRWDLKVLCCRPCQAEKTDPSDEVKLEHQDDASVYSIEVVEYLESDLSALKCDIEQTEVMEATEEDVIMFEGEAVDLDGDPLHPNVEDVEGVDTEKQAEDSNVDERLEREGTEENHSTDAVENNLEDMDVVLSIGDLIEKAEFNRLHS